MKDNQADPGAVTVGYIPEEQCRPPREEEEPKMGFKTSPEPAVKWNPITVATGAGE